MSWQWAPARTVERIGDVSAVLANVSKETDEIKSLSPDSLNDKQQEVLALLTAIPFDRAHCEVYFVDHSIERKNIHEACKHAALTSQSHGSGANRIAHVSNLKLLVDEQERKVYDRFVCRGQYVSLEGPSVEAGLCLAFSFIHLPIH
eukprot:TRINITY_DN3329_c0_g2_i5.p1 TRINITY_DN3329_c0_g2~~TRINITY_DN3329_c0_g2_i5.p1  ORF type:complete len:147 (+),score=8.22 TRINITY_DN3329_c0_g2_i5:88-528(+)